MPTTRLADIGDRESVDQDVHDIVDDDDEPGGHPGRRVRMKPGFRTFGPGRASRPWPVFQPRDMPRQVPTINDEMRTAYDSERIGILCYEEKRQKVKDAMY